MPRRKTGHSYDGNFTPASYAEGLRAAAAAAKAGSGYVPASYAQGLRAAAAAAKAGSGYVPASYLSGLTPQLRAAGGYGLATAPADMDPQQQ